jgi:predicted secreted hydrolase
MKRRLPFLRAWLCAASLFAAAGFLRCAPAAPPGSAPASTPATALLGEEEPAGFSRAQSPRDFRFPEDHGPHPAYRHEWWYFTGNLRSPEGRRFGYQLTFFRFALSPDPVDRESRWAANQAYMAHFAVTDADGGRFHHFERTGRGALGIAGAHARPFRAWLDDWSAQGGGTSTLPIRLQAREEGVAIDLLLDTGRPIVLQGDRGLSRKGPSPGNASYYYSMTRMATRGTVRLGDRSFAVTGNSWMDREWGTSALEKGQSGWDWFALQLSDGRDLMFYRLRRDDGATDPFSAGTLVLPDGSSRPLSFGDVRIETLATWKSPSSGARYPSRWRLLVPSETLELEVVPLLADQELRTTVRYWEGAAGVRGTSRGAPIEGEGYAELTGYGETDRR